MSTAQSAGDELGDVIGVYKHPGLKVALSALGVGALLCVLFIGLRTLWDDVPMGLGLALLLLGLAISITALIMLPVGLFNARKTVTVCQKGFSIPAKRRLDVVRWDDIVEMRRQASGPIFPGLLGDLFAVIGGTLIHYTIKQTGREDVVFSNQMVQGIDALAEQIAMAAGLTHRSGDRWTRP